MFEFKLKFQVYALHDLRYETKSEKKLQDKNLRLKVNEYILQQADKALMSQVGFYVTVVYVQKWSPTTQLTLTTIANLNQINDRPLTQSTILGVLFWVYIWDLSKEFLVIPSLSCWHTSHKIVLEN